ncbi:zinc finger protein 260-like [Ochlerotatus camptorhynchus]|uniref:zinc finger protein 260-like n=1 Tax=Ochlerotatus camptorhynchus TaxID=644619 RepID=UPI0031D8E314
MTKEDACRICCKTESFEMFRLSDPSFDGSRTTAQVIEDCFGLSISEEEMSSLHCVDCKNDLIVALRLVTKIRESDIKLKSILNIPKVEIVEPSENNISSVFIAEGEIKSEINDEGFDKVEDGLGDPPESPPKTPPKKRGRPRKLSVAHAIEIPDDNQESVEIAKEEQPVEKLIKDLDISSKARRFSTYSTRSDDALSASSGDSDDTDFEPDADSHDESDEQAARKRSYYGVKLNSEPKRCCSCKNFPLDSHDKVEEHSDKYHLKMRVTNPKDYGDNLFECPVCFVRFNVKKLFLQHQRKMYVDMLHPCKQCDEEFANFYVLQKHIQLNHKRKLKLRELEEMRIKSNICCGCRTKFNSQEELKEHAIKVHLPQREAPDGENTVECDVCYKTYKSIKYLKDHRLRFFKKKNLICAQCGRSFREKAQLEGHEDSHRNVRRYECPICHAKFSMKASWQAHVKYHDAQEIYHCEYCGKGFRKKGLMKAHLRIHSTDRPHKCPMCPLTFTQKNRLNSHVLEHSGLKSFKCDRCPASYVHQRALRRHVRDKHEGIHSFKCNICPKGFIELKPLLVHLKTHERSHEATFSKS